MKHVHMVRQEQRRTAEDEQSRESKMLLTLQVRGHKSCLQVRTANSLVVLYLFVDSASSIWHSFASLTLLLVLT